MACETIPGITTWPNRHTYLGASEVAGALGLHPHLTPRMVWLSKVDPERARQEGIGAENEDTARGIAMEPVIAYMLERQGLKLEPGGEWKVTGTPIIAHPDRLLRLDDGNLQIIEIKAPRRWSRWGPSGSGQVPQEYMVQVMIQAAALMEIVPTGSATIIAMCGELRYYTISAMHLLPMKRLLELILRWWDYHVVGGNEPGPHSAIEIADAVPSYPSQVVSDAVIQQLGMLKAVRQLETWAKAKALELKLRVLRSVVSGNDLPRELVNDHGEKVATVSHVRRSAYQVKESRWCDLRLARDLAMPRLPQNVVPEIIDEALDNITEEIDSRGDDQRPNPTE